MKLLTSALLILSIILCEKAIAQRGFTDNFEDASLQLPRRNPNAPKHTIWSTLSPGTYALTEEDSVLKIDYTKISGSGAFDAFRLSPPNGVNVRNNPHIQLRMKSSIATQLTLRPTYSLQPPTYEEVSCKILGDNQWHTYTFKLYDYLYEKFGVQLVDFYFDQGINKAAKGHIELDDVKIAWQVIHIDSLAVAKQEGSSIKLTWTSTDPENIGKYHIHRGTEPRFIASSKNLLAESSTSEYVDTNLEAYKLYYYRIIAIGTDEEVFLPSIAIRAETFAAGTIPTVQIKSTNTSTVKKYEKFELGLTLNHVGIHNPYDSDDIDVYAHFVSPEGKTTRINGFFDDYEGVNTWKVRFSAALTGKWSYQVFVQDAGGLGKTEQGSFTVVESSHHGWIKPSTKNPHYFMHDDGSSYFATGVYSPWRNNASRFKTFADHKANLFAIWDIGYGGFVNETGLIEEELGKYNQAKLGKIDSLLTILEKDDIQMMYALWPHDLFSATVWSAEWDKNPYRELVDAVDVYKDETVWEYQKKKYRYLIARFAHSRSMGIWELINEMNGTDGWKERRFESAYDWVERADKYFEENDPYKHPVTASFSGGFGEYRKPLYERNDIPNIHVYPAQGWALQYPEDTVRSSMYNYAWASQRFWKDFEKPAIIGEAGADLAYFNRRDPRYHEVYHNAIWASLSNGLAGIPIWWQFFHLSDRDWDHLAYLSDFVKDIDFENVSYRPAVIIGEGIDVYGLVSEQSAFGWTRSFTKENISQSEIRLQGLRRGKYVVKWFDTWNGKYLKTEKATSKKGLLVLIVPQLSKAAKDIAFKIEKK